MKCVVLAALLVSLTNAQLLQKAVIVDQDDPDMPARSVLFGFLDKNHEHMKPVDIYERLSKLEHHAKHLEQEVEKLSPHQHKHEKEHPHDKKKDAEDHRLQAYKKIAEMKPAFWLSAHYANGLHRVEGVPVQKNVSLTKDTVGNRVWQFDFDKTVLPVINDNGNAAFAFDANHYVMSSSSAHAHWTFVAAFRWPNANSGGRFFTSTIGNRLFAGHANGVPCVLRYYVEGWIDSDCVRSTQVEIDVATNNNGLKSLWRENFPVVINASIGANDWGTTILGRPYQFDGEATAVNVYEALVFERTLSDHEREFVASTFSKYLHH